MKNLQEYINEEKKTTSAGCVDMVKTIVDQLTKEHPDCEFNKEQRKWVGKDADLWKGAGQFIFDYMHELGQSEFKKIVDAMGWEKWIADVNDIDAAEIAMCLSLELSSRKGN